RAPPGGPTRHAGARDPRNPPPVNDFGGLGRATRTHTAGAPSDTGRADGQAGRRVGRRAGGPTCGPTGGPTRHAGARDPRNPPPANDFGGLGRATHSRTLGAPSDTGRARSGPRRSRGN